MPPKRSYSRVAVCILIGFLTLTSALAQDQSRALVWANHANINTGKVDPYWSKEIEAVELEDILVGGKSVKIGEYYVAERNWIRDITFRVKNISGEPRYVCPNYAYSA